LPSFVARYQTSRAKFTVFASIGFHLTSFLSSNASRLYKAGGGCHYAAAGRLDVQAH
jgi:hypothetical protein